ncbi:exodeoxyribonuclease VII small subunit [Luteibacter sp. PPL201]|uniref:Exodeoxyribonuclease 7 small subunit n=1 Tax=Luteibacter sahnii TaxID=3021977 RepID=A0ABT6B705_9GAMM
MPKSSDTPVPASSIAEFEHSLEELEQLVTRMEGGELSLDESLKSFERGIGLYRHCQTALEQAELRVRLLLDPESPENATPFDSRTD